MARRRQMRVAADAFAFDTNQLSTDDQEDVAARLHEELRDWLDVASELTPLQEREAAKSLTGLIEELKAHGLVVAVGAHTERLPPATPDGTAVAFTFGIVMTVLEADFKPFALWDRATAFRFR